MPDLDPTTAPAASGATFVPFDAEAGLTHAIRLPGSPEDFAARRGFDDLGALRDGQTVWIHLDRSKERAKRWLRTESGLDPIAAETLLAEETRPGAREVGEGLIVILRGVDMTPGADPDELISIRMWLEPGRIITLRQRRFQTTAELRDRARQGRGPATPGAFLAAVANGLAGRLAASVGNLEEMLDEIEDGMLDGEGSAGFQPAASGLDRRSPARRGQRARRGGGRQRQADNPRDRSRLATIRRQAITYRRYLAPQRDALTRLAGSEHPLLSQRDRAEVRHAAEQVARTVDALEEIRDRAAVTQEEMRARHEARMGRTLYVLTIVATVALPLGLITGLFGINVGGMPWTDSPGGFLIVCLVMLAIAAVEVVVFRWLRWL